jgi:ribonuclease HI
MSKKFYAIVKGVQPGVYDSWPKAEAQVKGFNGAVYKSFADIDNAEAWYAERVGSAPTHFLTQPLPATPPIKKHTDALAEGRVVIFTDGGADPNPGPGGYGVVLLFGTHRKELSGGFARTTNNRMELMACIVGLRALKRPSNVVLYTDSSYLANAIQKKWAVRWRANGWQRETGEPIVNADLWLQVLELLEQHTVELIWVKGHGGTKENERCDWLATQAAQQINLPDDVGYVA